MRMWGLAEQFMCRQHLLGEHVEMHIAAGSIAEGKSIHGFTTNGLIDTRLIQARHDELAQAIDHRGYIHASPLNYEDDLNTGWLDINRNAEDLFSRCEMCRAKWQEFLFGITPKERAL